MIMSLNYDNDQGACSDSMVAFALFVSLLDGDVSTKRPPVFLRKKLNEVLSIIDEVCTSEGIESVSLLNFVLADGDALLATRYVRAPAGVCERV